MASKSELLAIKSWKIRNEEHLELVLNQIVDEMVKAKKANVDLVVIYEVREKVPVK